MANEQNLKPFKKNDLRINRKGRPKNFDGLRALAQQIANEIPRKDGEPIVVSGHTATVVEMILRTWAQSKNPQLVRAFIEIAFGKVPEPVTLDGILNVQVEYVNDPLTSASPAPGAGEDRAEP